MREMRKFLVGPPAATATEGASHGTLRSLLSLDWRSQGPHTSYRTAKLIAAHHLVRDLFRSKRPASRLCRTPVRAFATAPQPDRRPPALALHVPIERRLSWTGPLS